VVEITIFVEGGVAPSLANPQLTPDSTVVLRESFNSLFSQRIDPKKFNLVVVPIGGYLNVPVLFLPEASKNDKAIALLDFAEPADDLEKAVRTGISKHSTLIFDKNDPDVFRSECIIELGLAGYRERVFFMNREMEAWILSQPEEIEKYGTAKDFIRKIPEETISGHASLRVLHPSLIKDPKMALNTIFIEFFDQQKRMRDGRLRSKAKQYIPSKDGPRMIAMLTLEKLMEVFPDAKNLVEWIWSLPTSPLSAAPSPD